MVTDTVDVKRFRRMTNHTYTHPELTMRFLTFVAFALIGPLTLADAEEVPSGVDESQLFVEINLFEQATPDVKKKELTNPKLLVTLNRPFRFQVGGDIKSNHGGENLPIGTRIRGTVERKAANEYCVSLSVCIGKPSSVKTDEADVVRAEILEIRTTMALQESKRLRVSGTKWCSVSIEPAADPGRLVQSREKAK